MDGGVAAGDPAERGGDGMMKGILAECANLMIGQQALLVKALIHGSLVGDLLDLMEKTANFRDQSIRFHRAEISYI